MAPGDSSWVIPLACLKCGIGVIVLLFGYVNSDDRADDQTRAKVGASMAEGVILIDV